MGAINYSKSDYITLGIKPYSVYDFENDIEFMKELEAEVEEYGGTIDESLDSYINSLYESDYENAESILKKYYFYNYHITLENGYYEGFYIDIENNFPIVFENYSDKLEAQKEITEIKKMLVELAGVGFVSCHPGWVSDYNDYSGTLLAINEAIKDMRQEVKNTPTWHQYNRGA